MQRDQTPDAQRLDTYTNSSFVLWHRDGTCVQGSQGATCLPRRSKLEFGNRQLKAACMSALSEELKLSSKRAREDVLMNFIESGNRRRRHQQECHLSGEPGFPA